MAAGEILVRQGDPSIHVYNVTSGVLRMYQMLADGRRQITGFLFAGDFIGLTGGEIETSFVEVVEASTLCRFKRGAFRNLMNEHRELEAALLAKAGDELAAAQRQLLVLGRKKAIERLATFLLGLPSENPLAAGSDDDVRLAMTRSDIADYLGLTLETISRSFTELKRRGLIRQDSLTDIHIQLRERLRALADGEF